MNKIVIPFSAGMDSTLLLYLAAEKKVCLSAYDPDVSVYDEIHTISFDYGQRHIRELDCVEVQLWDLRKKYPKTKFTNTIVNAKTPWSNQTNSSVVNDQVDTPDISKIAGDAQPVTYVPFRNLLFLTYCLSYAESIGAEDIWYGATKVDSLAGMWDCDESFIEAANNVAKLNRKNKITISAPLIGMDKKDIVLKGTELGIDWRYCWTCYSAGKAGVADATTPSSSLRISGFISAGLKDPMLYIQQEKLEKVYAENNCKDIKY